MTDAVLRFRLARCGLGADPPGTPAEALAAPVATTAGRDAVALALLARLDAPVDHREAVDDGTVVVAHAVRGASHALAPEDLARYGRALLAHRDDELERQLGDQVAQDVRRTGIAATDQLEEVAEAIRDALGGGARLDRQALHDALRERVQDALLPLCRGRCKTHHVAPMLWRYASIRAGSRVDADGRYRAATPGRAAAADALRGFLAAYGPARRADFAAWAGVATSHAARVWAEVEDELAPGPDGGHVLQRDAALLADPPDPAPGVRLLPPGDAALARPNRERLAPDAAVRKRLFRPVASPGAVLHDGELAGLWRVKAGKAGAAEVTVEALRRIPQRALQEQADRVARARGDDAATVVLN